MAADAYLAFRVKVLASRHQDKPLPGIGVMMLNAAKAAVRHAGVIAKGGDAGHAGG